VIFVVNLRWLFATTALAPISFMPTWWGWLAGPESTYVRLLNRFVPPTAGKFPKSAVVLQAPYGALTSGPLPAVCSAGWRACSS